MKYKRTERGLALLITFLVLTVFMGVSASLITLVTKQYRFASIGLQSEMAFLAAQAGMECIAYHDALNFPSRKFNVNGDGSGVAPEVNVSCMGVTSNDLINNGNTVVSGEEQRFQFSWGTPSLCSSVSIYKFHSNFAVQDMSAVLGYASSCSIGSMCTVIKARGYNVACANISNSGSIERELTQLY